MSYTNKIKNEITDVDYPTTEDMALVSGFIRNNGYIDGDKFIITTENVNTRDFLKKFFQNKYENY